VPKSPAKPKAQAPTLSEATRIAVLHGRERFLIDYHTHALREGLEKAHGQFDTLRFDGAASGSANLPAEILDECRSFGLMAGHKLVIVDNADALLKESEDDEDASDAPAASPRPAARAGPRRKTARELFESYAQDPSPSATLLLRATTWRPGRLDKAIAALGDSGGAGAVIKCEAPTAENAVAWCRARCRKQHAVELAPDAAALLVDHIGPDLARLDTELAKLACVDPGKPITAEVVREFVGYAREEKFFAIQGSLVSGDAGAALAHLRELVEVSRQDPVPLNWAYIDLARKLHGASVGLAAGENPYALAGRLKLWGPQQESLFRTARKLRPGDAAALLQAAVQTDVKLKTGQGDPVVNLEVLTLRFAASCR
jgi:DNA polymerase III delta subunit